MDYIITVLIVFLVLSILINFALAFLCWRGHNFYKNTSSEADLVEQKIKLQEELKYWSNKLASTKAELNSSKIKLDNQRAGWRETFLKDFYENLYLPLKKNN